MILDSLLTIADDKTTHTDVAASSLKTAPGENPSGHAPGKPNPTNDEVVGETWQSATRDARRYDISQKKQACTTREVGSREFGAYPQRGRPDQIYEMQQTIEGYEGNSTGAAWTPNAAVPGRKEDQVRYMNERSDQGRTQDDISGAEVAEHAVQPWSSPVWQDPELSSEGGDIDQSGPEMTEEVVEIPEISALERLAALE
jgi:hypothetical protein